MSMTTAAALLVSVCGLLSAVPTNSEGTRPGSKLGQKVQDFEIRDYRGKVHRLSDYSSDKLVVLVFLGTECPLVRAYAPKLEQLATTYADQGVRFLGVNSNLQDSLTEIAAYARSYGINFPILKDNENALADEVGAVRTPEALVLDGDRVIRYHGRIDDQIGVGYKRPSILHDDLVQAIEELLAGKEVTVASTDAPGCHIGRMHRSEPTGSVTYSNQIARIFQNRCERCHRAGEIGPFPMQQYSDVVGWAETIAEVVDQRRMPPWFASPKHDGEFHNEARMTPEEIALVKEWVANGAPEGDPKDLPEPVEFVSGWQIKPDQVWHMNDKPFTVPAEGVVPYKHFVVDLGLTEDKWIQTAEARPGVYSVVHHILVFLQEPGVMYPGMPGELMAAYAPGFPPVVAPPGMAMRARKGSKIVFQMHYTPDGVDRDDNSYFGVTYADPASVEYRVHVQNAINFTFKIPAHADNVPVVATRKIGRDCLLLGLNPHMHQRGKSYTYEAVYPDGKKEILLDIPRFDFNWQIPCMYKEPHTLPAGTKLVCTGVFDNSENNLSNPNPSQDVKWGDQTWEEMQIGWYTVAEKLTPKEEAEKNGGGE